MTEIPVDPIKLRRLLTNSFSLSELHTFTWDLRIEFENLAGETRDAKVRELIDYCARRGLLEKLVEAAQKERPHLNWAAEVRPDADEDVSSAPETVHPPRPPLMPRPDISSNQAALTKLRTFSGLVDGAWGLFITQNNHRGRLYTMIQTNHAGRIPPYRGYDDLFYKMHPQFSEEEVELFTIIRGMTEYAVRNLNESLLEWVKDHPIAELMPQQTPAVTELEKQVGLLRLHLEQWFAKYEETFRHDKRRALVYLGDEKTHGQPWPRGLEPALAAVLAELARGDMRIVYDRTTDTLTAIFSEATVTESGESKPGVILDYDAGGKLVALSILSASQRVTVPGRIDYKITPSD